MNNSSQPISLSGRFARAVGLAGSLGLILCMVGCSNTTTKGSSSSSSTPQQVAPVYMAPAVSGTSFYGGSPQSPTRSVDSVVYSIDETNEEEDFEETDYNTLGTGFSVGVSSQTLNAGHVAAVGQRGLHTMATSTSYGLSANSTSATWVATNYNPSLTGGFAVELSGQAGGFVQLAGQPVAPVVNAAQCPDSATHTYQFITIPSVSSPTWDPATDTAYGSVDVSSSGSTVNFQNIHQFTLVSGTPSQPFTPSATSPASGTCGSTYFGNVTNVPGNSTITNPGTKGQTVSPQAMIGIGASNGLLVEDNGYGNLASSGTMPGTNLKYYNILGAGTGAVGIAKPSSALDTGAVVGAQYLGFIYDSGVYTDQNALQITGWSSHLTSFGGISTVPSACASMATGANTLIGGDFTNDDPSTSSYGKGDVAIVLGSPQDSSNSLYPKATVCLDTNYAANTSGSVDTFSAVAIAGQINGKYAIFLIGDDNVQPWTIYLLQSN
jgi:hypothetical protein